MKAPDVLTRATIWVLVSWAAAVFGTVAAVTTGNWTAGIYAWANAVSAAGWAIASRQADLWRGVSEGLIDVADRAARRPPRQWDERDDDHPDDGKPRDFR